MSYACWESETCYKKILTDNSKKFMRGCLEELVLWAYYRLHYFFAF